MNTRYGTRSVVKSAIRNVACNLAKPASNLLWITDWRRFRINKLTRLVPMPVRFVLRNDDNGIIGETIVIYLIT